MCVCKFVSAGVILCRTDLYTNEGNYITG